MIIICPGIHDPILTQNFINKLNLDNNNLIKTFPVEKYPAYSSFHIVEYLKKENDYNYHDLIFISFSAGVVGAIGAANIWQFLGGNIKAFIALDGWGVPLIGNFPIYRLSHDYFTHFSSNLLGFSKESFYADPEVNHLQLWGSSHIIYGWIEKSMGCYYQASDVEFIRYLLRKYEKIPSNLVM